MSSFLKRARLLRPQEFREVYDHGTRFSTSLFSAFLFRKAGAGEARLGLTTPRAFGNAVLRNRARRRVREAMRDRLGELSPEWCIVINPRRKILDCSWSDLQREIARLVQRCKR